MTDLLAGTVPGIDEARRAYRDELLAAGLLVTTGVAGVYGRSGAFEAVLDAVDRLFAARSAGDGAEVVRFPPVVARSTYEVTGHLRSFPHLVGAVHGFSGDDRAHAEVVRRLDAGEAWSESFVPTEVVLTPAACYPTYAMVAGTLPAAGRLLDVASYCFRHEPSADPMRQQLFRMHEQVRFGTEQQVATWRDQWMERTGRAFADMGLEVVTAPANDPFFGRAGRLLAASQRQQHLKTEFLVPILSEEHPTACASVNSHQDHFTHVFGIRTADGEHAHSGCVGYGLERLTLALFRAHGFQPSAWPASVSRALFG